MPGDGSTAPPSRALGRSCYDDRVIRIVGRLQWPAGALEGKGVQFDDGRSPPGLRSGRSRYPLSCRRSIAAHKWLGGCFIPVALLLRCPGGRLERRSPGPYRRCFVCLTLMGPCAPLAFLVQASPRWGYPCPAGLLYTVATAGGVCIHEIIILDCVPCGTRLKAWDGGCPWACA